jgi:hypothetical protein
MKIQQKKIIKWKVKAFKMSINTKIKKAKNFKKYFKI